MDQLKEFLKQCVKYRFWIAFGVSLLLPMIGYFVGIGSITGATTKREAEIKSAKAEIGKYTARGIVNAQYQPIALTKKEALEKDVDASWRKLFTLQEPLLKWPEEVQSKFLQWGRKYPVDVDKGQVTSTIIDYTVVYPNFVSQIYKTFKPFNFDDGSGVVVADDEKGLLRPAAFSPDAPPEFGKIWAEQERLWVVTALLDVVAKVNDSVGAKDWDGAIIKQIKFLEVGSPSDQDQKSIAKGVELVASDPLADPSAPPPAEAAAAPPGGGMGGAGMMMAGAGSGAGTAAAAGEVFYLKTEGEQFKVLPIKMTVLVEQSKIADFLIGLENSPMAIQVMEPEITKPLAPVMKPAYGEKAAFGIGMGGDMGGMSGMRGQMGRQGAGGMSRMPGMPGMSGMPGGNNRSRGEMGGMSGMMPGMPGMPGMGGGGGAAVKKGTDNRSVNKAAERAKREKEEAKAKPETKAKVDTYYNVVEVTVYGQARFYLAPPPLPPETPSTAPAAAPETPKAEDTKLPESPSKEEVPQVETPKAEEAPKAVDSKPESDMPKGEEPKGESPTSKADASKAEPAKGETLPKR